ncbi:MAG: hypothetical protein IJI45_00395 [Anaerolineaceae bacterium]|nr:hypothetical protein [Anaerolineaceae bacterium]
MKKRFLIILFCLILLIPGCTGNQKKENDTLPEVAITVIRGKEDYTPGSLLLDSGFCTELEEKLGIKMQISVVSYTEPFREDVEVTFTGGLITPNCLWMVPMSSGYQLEKLNKSAGMKEPQYGRLGTTQYSYVFSDPDSDKNDPILIANLEFLEAAGVSLTDYTPEGLYHLLLALSQYCDTPLSVYGAPSEEGFSVLLNLFGLAPTGGREFYLDRDSFQFDKVSDKAREYLTYVRKLYLEKLIPEDCMIMNEYAARKQFLSRRTGLSAFPSTSNAADTIALAEKAGIRAAVIPIPSSSGKLASAVYNHPIGLISFNYPYVQQLLSVYEELEKACSEQIVSVRESMLPEETLFVGRDTESYSDLLRNLIPEIGTLYNKHLMDQMIITPYYTKVLTGAVSIDSFDEMRSRWFNDYVQINDSPNAELSGRSLLQIMTGWYYKYLRDK